MSRGEKHDPAGRATPLFAFEGYFPGPGGEGASGKRVVGAREAPTGLTALGTGGGLVRGWGGLGIGIDVLLQEPGGEILSELAGSFFALVEGDELVLDLGVEHQV